MRVLVAVDAMAGLGSLAAGEVIGRAFAAHGAQVAVVPVGDRAADVRAALGHAGSSQQVVDLREPLPGALPTGVIGLVDEDELHRPLTGLHGVAAASGREQGWDIARVLAEDAEAALRAAIVWPANPDAATQPGGGAHGGRGLAVLAAGGRLATGAGLCAEVFGLDTTATRADLVVTGCDTLDFGAFGGAVVLEVVRAAGAAARPVVVVTGRNAISSRELRSAGIESAHVIEADEGLAGASSRLAASWNQ